MPAAQPVAGPPRCFAHCAAVHRDVPYQAAGSPDCDKRRHRTPMGVTTGSPTHRMGLTRNNADWKPCPAACGGAYHRWAPMPAAQPMAGPPRCFAHCAAVHQVSDDGGRCLSHQYRRAGTSDDPRREHDQSASSLAVICVNLRIAVSGAGEAGLAPTVAAVGFGAHRRAPLRVSVTGVVRGAQTCAPTAHIRGTNMMCAFGVPGFISQGWSCDGMLGIPVVSVVA